MKIEKLVALSVVSLSLLMPLGGQEALKLSEVELKEEVVEIAPEAPEAPVTQEVPEVVETPQPAPKRAYSAGVEQWRPLVSQYEWPVETALAIMNCESGGNPNAWSRTSDGGLFQINMPTWNGHYGITMDTVFDPATNVYAGYRIWKNRGNFSAWVCARKI